MLEEFQHLKIQDGCLKRSTDTSICSWNTLFVCFVYYLTYLFKHGWIDCTKPIPFILMLSEKLKHSSMMHFLHSHPKRKISFSGKQSLQSLNQRTSHTNGEMQFSTTCSRSLVFPFTSGMLRMLVAESLRIKIVYLPMLNIGDIWSLDLSKISNISTSICLISLVYVGP